MQADEASAHSIGNPRKRMAPKAARGAATDYKSAEKRDPLTLLVGMQTSAATMENSVEIP